MAEQAVGEEHIVVYFGNKFRNFVFKSALCRKCRLALAVNLSTQISKIKAHTLHTAVWCPQCAVLRRKPEILSMSTEILFTKDLQHRPAKPLL